MARTRANSLQINKSIAGSDLINQLGFYDETKNYNINDQVKRGLNVYRAKNAVTGLSEGDYSNSPDISSDWESVDSISYTIHPSTSQALTTSKSDIIFDTEDTTTPSFNLVSNQIVCLKQCVVFVAMTISADISSGGTRSESRYNLQIDTGAGYVDVPNTEIILYHRTAGAGGNTATIIKPFDLNVGDKIKVQGIITTGSNISTSVDGCILSIRTPASGKGDKGDKGDTGADGDITRQGAFVSGVTTANLHEAYEFQGQSYVCLNNGTTDDPNVSSVNRDLLAKKGIDGSGATINVSQEGIAITNTPHGTLNFKGDIDVTDAGGGVADINIIKNSYIIPIRAEENSGLSDNTYEWAFGNGAQTPNDGGVTIYVPTGYSANIVGMSLRLGSGTATVEAVVDGVLQGASCDVTVSAGQGNTNDLFTPVSISNGSYVNFRTTVASGTSGPNVATMRIEYTKI